MFSRDTSEGLLVVQVLAGLVLVGAHAILTTTRFSGRSLTDESRFQVGQSQKHSLLHPVSCKYTRNPRQILGSREIRGRCLTERLRVVTAPPSRSPRRSFVSHNNTGDHDDDGAPLVAALPSAGRSVSSVFAAFDGIAPEMARATPVPVVCAAAGAGQPLPGAGAGCPLDQATAIAELQHCFRYALGEYGWMLNSYASTQGTLAARLD